MPETTKRRWTRSSPSTSCTVSIPTLDRRHRSGLPFRFPTVSRTRKIRRGRRQAISVADGQCPRLVFEVRSDVVSWKARLATLRSFTARLPGPFNGRIVDSIYSEAGTSLNMALFPILPPPIPLSGAMLSWSETARRNGTVDFELGHAILQARKQPTLDPTTGRTLCGLPARTWTCTGTCPCFLVLLDKDPTVSANWLSKGNPLSIYTWVEKVHSFENVHLMMEKATLIGYSEADVRTLQLLADKLAPLQGR
jgi:hypothetical protein